jgi:hypothetical protein
VDAVCRLRRSRSRCYGQVTISNPCDPVTALRDAVATTRRPSPTSGPGASMCSSGPGTL